jgi:hypothetical protein
MLRPVKLAEQWREVQNGLPGDWGDARLELAVSDASRSDRAASLLGPLQPGRRGNRLRFSAARRGAGPSPDAVARALARLDAEGVDGTLTLLASEEAVEAPAVPRPRLAALWDSEVAALPSDWSDVYAELELDSTDYLERGALLCAPINPARVRGEPAFRFRCAARFGYGASGGMVRRCLERLDAEGITGKVRVLRALSDSKPVATQGPVWYVGGKAV